MLTVSGQYPFNVLDVEDSVRITQRTTFLNFFPMNLSQRVGDGLPTFVAHSRFLWGFLWATAGAVGFCWGGVRPKALIPFACSDEFRPQLGMDGALGWGDCGEVGFHSHGGSPSSLVGF